MEQPIEKFQRLLREIFQFDRADPDFGIYRIMNHERDLIEKAFVHTPQGKKTLSTTKIVRVGGLLCDA